jgi:hypothetical protein
MYQMARSSNPSQMERDGMTLEGAIRTRALHLAKGGPRRSEEARPQGPRVHRERDRDPGRRLPRRSVGNPDPRGRMLGRDVAELSATGH